MEHSYRCVQCNRKLKPGRAWYYLDCAPYCKSCYDELLDEYKRLDCLPMVIKK